MLSTFVTAGVSALLLSQQAAGQSVFTSDDLSGELEKVGEGFEPPEGPAPDPDGNTIARANLPKRGNLMRLCGCTDKAPTTDGIRDMSDKWMGGGTRVSSHGFSQLVWAWGQWIDHDIVATVDQDGKDTFSITLKDGGKTAEMKLHRLVSDNKGGCPAPVIVNTPAIDAGTVYGNDDIFMLKTLRDLPSCMLRTSGGDEEMLPITTKKNKDGNHVFVAGDGRVDEHAVLTSMHTLFVREHNRLCRYMMTDPKFSDMNPETMFEKARAVVTAKMQWITLKEWLPALGISESSVRNASPKHSNADISVEFSTAAYRFGHDMVPDFMGGLSIVKLFDGNKFYGITKSGKPASGSSKKMDRVFSDAAGSVANEIDGKFSNALRNTLFGKFGEDLASRNIFRGRDMQMPLYDEICKCFGTTPKPTIMNETPEPFIGLLRENGNPGGSVFGETLKKIYAEQFHRIFFKSGGKWWESNKGAVSGFEEEIKKTTLSRVIRSNTKAKVQTKAFSVKGKTYETYTFPQPPKDIPEIDFDFDDDEDEDVDEEETGGDGEEEAGGDDEEETDGDAEETGGDDDGEEETGGDDDGEEETDGDDEEETGGDGEEEEETDGDGDDEEETGDDSDDGEDETEDGSDVPDDVDLPFGEDDGFNFNFRRAGF